jgi:hypothetical protein
MLEKVKMWSVTVSANKSQFSTIIKTANIMSRPSFGNCLPVSMTADIITTLMLMTESVRITVPYDTSNLKARHSACFTTPKESQKKKESRHNAACHTGEPLVAHNKKADECEQSEN